METKISINLRPFSVPNFVIEIEEPKSRQEGFKPAVGIPLARLDTEVLKAMCEEFAASVFKKAGKKL